MLVLSRVVEKTASFQVVLACTALLCMCFVCVLHCKGENDIFWVQTVHM